MPLEGKEKGREKRGMRAFFGRSRSRVVRGGRTVNPTREAVEVSILESAFRVCKPDEGLSQMQEPPRSHLRRGGKGEGGEA